MTSKRPNKDDQRALDEVLGYLNFSAGGTDRQFLANIDRLFRGLADGSADVRKRLAELLQHRLEELATEGTTFRDAEQARRALDLFANHVPAAYREFHRDLLAHQEEAAIWNSLFCGRALEAILQELTAAGGEGDPKSLAKSVVTRLNDYVGHRPLATLETRRTEPYAHEWHRPVPLFVRGVGAAAGPYERLVTEALQILERTDPQLLSAADFDPQQLEELAMDARAYDYDHPANKRPNYHFGHWDPNHIDSGGNYRRYVVRQEILEALVQRISSGPPDQFDDLLFESAAALAGTVLMSVELSGSGPTAHSSDVTLGTLMPRIAAHRDRFYEELLKQLGPKGARLRAEAQERRQPFGGVRQYLNAELAQRRAAQLEHVHLARLLARIGQIAAAAEQIAAVSTARARMVCQMQCLLSAADQALDGGKLDAAADMAANTHDLLLRAIECGALVDPWNILGCDAQFSLFPALENSVPDHRIDELLELIAQLLQTMSRGWTLAAAAGNVKLRSRIEKDMTQLAAWWDPFATTTVSSVEGIAAGAMCDAASVVAEALAAWHGSGTTAGDIGFWRPYVARFESPKAFVLVVEALLDREDFVAAMALLMQWLSEADRVPLGEADASFQAMAGRWLRELLSPSAADKLKAEQQWKLVARFFDSIEANAEEWGHVPTLSTSRSQGDADSKREARAEPGLAGAGADDDDDEDDDDLFAAAYDGMLYRDSTDDGIDQDMLGGPAEGEPTDHELEYESRRIGTRLAFLTTLAKLWKYTAEQVAMGRLPGDDSAERLRAWLAQLTHIRERLGRLLTAVSGQPIPRPGGSSDSLLQYDRLRWIKDALTEQVIAAAVCCDEASLMLAAAMDDPTEQSEVVLGARRGVAARVMGALMRDDAVAVRHVWPQLLDTLSGEPLLYVPLAKGGDPEKIAAARSFQRLLRLLLGMLPKLGLLAETDELLHMAGEWERQQGAAAGAVTEFDDLLKIANQAMADCIVAAHAPKESGGAAENDDAMLIDDLDTLVQAILVDWLRHSRNLRLSVLERVADQPRWQQLVDLIKKYGADLFVQQFLHAGHLRAILHRGVEGWLEDVDRQGSDFRNLRLVEAIREGTAPKRAVELLQLVLEAVVENYTEYRDYNSTTTQSDRGDLFYTLLDLLRLRVQYDRVDWNISPVAQVHEVLVRHGRTTAAEKWRQELVERTGVLADELLTRLDELQKRYAMRLPTVAGRLRERFVRPLMVDRAKALLRPAIAEIRSGRPGMACAEFQQEVEELSREPTGVGWDVPQWLETLDAEVEQILAGDARQGLADSLAPAIPQRRLTRTQVVEQLERMQREEE